MKPPPQETKVTRVSELNTLEISGEACLVCIYGPELGKKWTLNTESLVVGRGPQNDIVVDLDNISRRHAQFTVLAGAVTVKDLGSTNGTYLNEVEVDEEVLKNGDHVKVGGAIFKFLTGGNIESRYHEEIYLMTIIDGLTQIHNKRYFLEAVEREMARASRFGRPLHLVMFDIDHFKNVNDEFGHIAGDFVLSELCGLVKKLVRREEIFARYGGEEFAMVIPEVPTDKVSAYGEKIRALVDDHEFQFEDRRIPVTISVGIAPMPKGGDDLQAFIQLADKQLYEAKHGGRNQVKCA